MEFIRIENRLAILLNDSDIDMMNKFRSPVEQLVLSEPKENPIKGFRMKTVDFYKKLVQIFGYDVDINRNNPKLLDLEYEMYIKDLSQYLMQFENRNLIAIKRKNFENTNRYESFRLVNLD